MSKGTSKLSNLVYALFAVPAIYFASGCGRAWWHDYQLSAAITRCDIARVSNELARGANPNIDVNEMPCIIYVTRTNAGTRTDSVTTAIAEMLLEKGADVNAKDGHGESALISAAHEDDRLMAAILLKYGADTSASFLQGWTPLMYAASNHHPEMVRILIEHGADPNVSTKSGDSPLRSAERYKDKELAQYLVAHGAR